jgi:antitoxin ParD1/3/4/toxin ParE1/3/4
MRLYELTPEARGDLADIADYIATRGSLERALKVIRDLREAFRNLAQMPGMGHFRDDLLDRRYKFWCVYSYLIAYEWQVKPIRVIAVAHGARDLETFFETRPPQ